MDSILDLLNSRDPSERKRGIFLLAASPEDSSLLLINNIAEYDESDELRFFARRILAAINRTFLPELVKSGLSEAIGAYLSLPGEKQRLAFFEAGLPREASARSLFLGLILFYEKNASAISRAILALGENGLESDIKRIASFNGDSRAEVRRAVFDALAAANNRKAFPLLAQFVIDDEPGISGDAVNFFKSLDIAMAVKVVRYMRAAESEKMKTAAARAAGCMPAPEMFDELKPLFECESPAVRKAALAALNAFIGAAVPGAAEFAAGIASLGFFGETLFDIKKEIDFDNFSSTVEEKTEISGVESSVAADDGGAEAPVTAVGKTPAAAEDDANAIQEAPRPEAYSTAGPDEKIAAPGGGPGEKSDAASVPEDDGAAGPPADEKNAETQETPENLPLFPLESGMKFGYIDPNGKLVIPFSFDRASIFVNGLAAVLVGIKWGYIDRKGDFAITPQFEEAYDFSEGLARVLVAQKYGFINEKGQSVLKPQFEDARDFSEGFAAVKAEGRWNFVNADGKTQFKNFDYERVSSFKNGYALVRKNKKYGFVNKKGELKIKCEYDAAEDFAEGLACVKTASKYGFITEADRFAIKPQFDRAREFSDGLAAVETEKLYGFIDRAGKLAIACSFEYAANFSEGLAAIKKGELWGYVNAEGAEAIEARFAEAGRFRDGLAYVKSGASYTYIDKTGKAIYGDEGPEKPEAKAPGAAETPRAINRNISIPAGTVHAIMLKLGYPFGNWKSTRSGHQPPPKSAEFFFLKASSGLNKSFNYSDLMDLVEAIKREHHAEVASGILKFLEANYASLQ